MAEIIKLGQPPIEVLLKRSARARRLSLRISGVDGLVSLTLPHHVMQRDAVSFLNEKEGWVRKHLESKPEIVHVRAGASIPIEGRHHAISTAPHAKPRIDEGTLLIPEDTGKASAKVKVLLKEMARTRLFNASGYYADILGRNFGRITLRDTRSRWGSCTSEGNLMYSWRLIMAPSEVLEYVAAHEVSHLVEMNHSPAFWDTVARLMPNYAEPRRWLRQNGASLHRYQF